MRTTEYRCDWRVIANDGEQQTRRSWCRETIRENPADPENEWVTAQIPTDRTASNVTVVHLCPEHADVVAGRLGVDL